MKILMPFDFSDASLNAFNYALDMLDGTPEIHIIHVASGLMTSGKFSHIGEENKLLGLKEEIETLLTKNLGISTLPDFIKVNIGYGDIIGNINHYAKTYEIDEILMATKDQYDIVDRWLGTVSFGVVKTSQIPVTLVPPNVDYSPIKNVLCALDDEPKIDRQLDYLTSWNNAKNARLSFLHIKDSNKDNFDQIKEDLIERYFEAKMVDFSFDIVEINQKEIAKGILDFAEQEAYNLICIFPRTQAMMETIFFKSVSKALILAAKCPLFFIPQSSVEQEPRVIPFRNKQTV